MKKLILSLLAFAISGAAFASPVTMDVLNAPQGLTIQTQRGSYLWPNGNQTNEAVVTAFNAAAVQNKTFDNTSNVSLLANGVFDVSVNGASGATMLTIPLPKYAILKKAYLDVITQPTSGSTGIKVNISAKSFGDLLVNQDITAMAVGPSVLTFSAAPEKLTSSASSITVDLTGTPAALTAGKFRIFVDYVLSPL